MRFKWCRAREIKISLPRNASRPLHFSPYNNRRVFKMGKIFFIHFYKVHLYAIEIDDGRRDRSERRGFYFSRALTRSFRSTISTVCIPPRLKLGLRGAFSPRNWRIFFSLNPTSRSIEFFHVTHDVAGRYIRPDKRTDATGLKPNFQHRIGSNGMSFLS